MTIELNFEISHVKVEHQRLGSPRYQREYRTIFSSGNIHLIARTTWNVIFLQAVPESTIIYSTSISTWFLILNSPFHYILLIRIIPNKEQKTRLGYTMFTESRYSRVYNKFYRFCINNIIESSFASFVVQWMAENEKYHKLPILNLQVPRIAKS